MKSISSPDSYHAHPATTKSSLICKLVGQVISEQQQPIQKCHLKISDTVKWSYFFRTQLCERTPHSTVATTVTSIS